MVTAQVRKAKRPKSNLSKAIEFIKKSVGSEIRYRRKKAGLTQADLAIEAKVRVETISRIELEKENPTIDTLVRVIRALEKLGA